jgi:hypothetical protein
MERPDLLAIRDRAMKATRGPWVDATQALRHYHAVPGSPKWRARRGHALRNTAAWAVLGAPRSGLGPISDDHFPDGADQYDYEQVFVLPWWAIKGTSFTGGPSVADAEFIVHAREDIPRLLAYIDVLEQRLAGE